MSESASPDKRDADVFICRASGEGSQDFRICADEAAVFEFYEEMTGRDQDGTLDSIIKSFADSDNWSCEGRAFSLDLYMACFEVWRVEPREIAFTPSHEQRITASGVQQADALPAVHQGQETKAPGLSVPSTTPQKTDDFGPFDPAKLYREFPAGGNNERGDWLTRCLTFICARAVEEFKASQSMMVLVPVDEYERLTTASATACSADAKDAARYRWLRDKSEPGICAFYLSVGAAFHKIRFKPQTVDEAIDDQINRPDGGKATT